MAINFEDCRKKWRQSGEELLSCKEMLAKAETERGALEVKLKHARNQVDVEIRRRQNAEAVHEKLVCNIFFHEAHLQWNLQSQILAAVIHKNVDLSFIVLPPGASATADPGHADNRE